MAKFLNMDAQNHFPGYVLDYNCEIRPFVTMVTESAPPDQLVLSH